IDFTASSKASGLLVVRKAGALTPTLAVTPAGGLAAAATPAAGMFDISGTPVTGDAWKVTLNGVTYSVTVGASVDLGNGPVVVDTLTEIAQALAKAISGGANGFGAAAEGTRLVIAGPAGAAMSTSFTPATASTPSWGSAFTTATAAFATLTGTPVVGDLYVVVLNGVTLSHVVTTGEGREAVAKALAALITDSALPALSDFTALGDGSQLVIAKRSGG